MTDSEKHEEYKIDWGGSVAVALPSEVVIDRGRDGHPVLVTLVPLARRGFPLPKPKASV